MLHEPNEVEIRGLQQRVCLLKFRRVLPLLWRYKMNRKERRLVGGLPSNRFVKVDSIRPGKLQLSRRMDPKTKRLRTNRE